MSPSVAPPPTASLATTDRVALRAGPLAMVFDAGDLRWIKLGEQEVIRRIYAAVRDRNWGTVPAEISELQARVTPESFHISYLSTHRRDDIHFEWRGEIAGEADGTIRFTFDGEARTSFLRNRIGFCVLHPADCAGARCIVRRSAGPPAELRFPRLVEAAQPVPGIHDMTAFSHEFAPGAWAELHFDGDRFEMEDQRNWIDASFKTFCTPLHLPYPVEVPARTRIRQEILLKLIIRRAIPARETRAALPIRIAISNDRRPLPAIGLGRASHGQPLTAQEATRIAQLRPAHLRADLKLGEPGWLESLTSAHHEAAQLQIPLELAVHLPSRGAAKHDLDEIVRRLRVSQTEIARVLLFRVGEKTVSAASVVLARPRLAALGAPVGAGTDADFYQLNQFRPPHELADFVHWSMNPQVHAFDLVSIAEAPTAIAAQLESARAFFPNRPLVISPVTLKPRFNPVAAEREKPRRPGELPSQVDPRQLSPFAAAWTLAVIKHLVESGAASVTLFETTGWRGVLEREAGSPLAEAFPSQPGQLFPLYHVLAEIGAFADGEAVATRSSDPFRVASLALIRTNRACLLLANLTDQPQRVQMADGRTVSHAKLFDWTATDAWMWDPQFVSRAPSGASANNMIELPPFGLGRFNLS